jgi:hypothetical protein
MNKLKTSKKVPCFTCMTPVKRVKTILVKATDQAAAIVEANAKIEEWSEAIKLKNCRFCQDIINDLNKPS